VSGSLAALKVPVEILEAFKLVSPEPFPFNEPAKIAPVIPKLAAQIAPVVVEVDGVVRGI
jgi:hypothetical protein